MGVFLDGFIGSDGLIEVKKIYLRKGEILESVFFRFNIIKKKLMVVCLWIKIINIIIKCNNSCFVLKESGLILLFLMVMYYL